MKHNAAAADLSGGKASADSLIPRRMSFAPEDARDLTSDRLLDVALGSTVSSDEFVRILFPGLKTDRSRSEVDLRSRFSNRGFRWAIERSSFTYRRICGHWRLGGWSTAKSRVLRRGLGLILWDEMRPDQLSSDLRGGRLRLWLHFVLDGGLSA